ncbi:porin [Stigmatella aurantiaca]|nr:porin [Stigmatella aurantiaca]ADO71694.1 Phosphate-selective porin O and P family protein [Stigmatella aurantiaca DW4/3-1]
MRSLLAALSLLISGAALAQDATPQPPLPSPAASEPREAVEPSATTPQERPPPRANAPSVPEASPSIDERLTADEHRVEALEEQNTETKNDLSALKKLRISGYIQARYQYQEPLDEITGAGGFSRFTIRRSRLKATYTTDLAQAMIQIDASPTGVALRDAEATLFIPGTKQQLSLTVGQMKWPFGYEGPQSSSDREFPERTRVTRNLLPSERDRGAKVNGRYKFLRLAVGMFDGAGIDSGTTQDNDKEKDLIGHVGFDLKWIAGGVSGWYGHALGKLPTDTFRRAYDRSRVGVDLQTYFDLLPVGGTSLKGEFLAGRTYGAANNATHLDVPAHGWYLLLVQNIGLNDAVGFRYDSFDPHNGQPDDGTLELPGADNTVDTVGFVVQHHFGENLKMTASYELPITHVIAQAQDPHDNLFTLQMQARF